MDNMDAAIAQQIMDAYDLGENTTVEEREANGRTKYNAWFGSVAKRKLYGKYQEKVDILLETTISTVTNTDYSACIVTYLV